jgi:S-DNA-T family DNA segregation ATPase FtsK/SpoIIIE
MSRIVVRVFSEPEIEGQAPLDEAVFDAKDEITIGRAATCDVVLQEDLVSRVHAKLAVRPGRVVLTDLSENGVFIRGRRLTGPVVLRDPIPFVIGSFRLVAELTE